MVNIGDYNAYLIDRTITPNEIITVSNWLEGAASPTYIRQQDSFKTITLTLIVEGNSEQDMNYNISNVINAFRKEKVLEFEDMQDFIFPAALDGMPSLERLKPCVTKVELRFKGNYMRTKEEKVVEPDLLQSNTFSFTVGGTAPTPLKLVLIPISSTIVRVGVSGLLEGGFTLRNIPADHKLVIDTENGEVNLVNLTSGVVTPAIDCYQDAWELPILEPGTYTVSLDYTSGYTMSLTYHESYV